MFKYVTVGNIVGALVGAIVFGLLTDSGPLPFFAFFVGYVLSSTAVRYAISKHRQSQDVRQ